MTCEIIVLEEFEDEFSSIISYISDTLRSPFASNSFIEDFDYKID